MHQLRHRLPPHHREDPASEAEELEVEGDVRDDDVSRAVQRMGWKVGSKRELRKIPEHLWEGETLDYLGQRPRQQEGVT